MTYTKKQRNEIYRKARSISYIMKGRGAGMCWLLQQVIFKKEGEVVGYTQLRHILPEFEIFAPGGGGWFYWWGKDKEGYNERLTALFFCIAMTED
jgi:hypothetical protein